MDYRLALICGTDIPVEKCQLVIHQPRINEISLIGERSFFSGVQCLCLYKNMFVEGNSDLLTINNFHIFMTIMQEKEAKDKKEATKQVLTLLFPNYKILFTPKSLIFQQQDAENIIVDETNFEDLQEVFRKIFCMTNAPMDQQAFNPGGDKAQEIAKKLMRGRERIAAEKQETNSSVFTQYMSSLSIGCSLNLQDLTQLTMFQLYDLVERYMLWTNWDLDVRVKLAGGKTENKAENWMKNIHGKEQ